MADPIGQQAKPRRLWKIVFAVSLALNLAVVGIVVGAAASGRLGDKPPRSFDLGVGPVAKALSPAERRDVGRNLRQTRVLRTVDPRGRARDMAAVLRADPFDPDALRTLFSEQSVDMATVQQRAQEALLQTISEMTPERRAAFAEQLLQEIRRGPRDGDRNSGG